MKKRTTRILRESSWLAQSVQDEIDTCSNSCVSSALQVLKYIVNAADDVTNQDVYRENRAGKLHIIVRDIPSMIQHGSDFGREGMRSKLRGLAEKYTNDDGSYNTIVLTTHDLNSAVINISDLMHQIRLCKN